MAMCGSTISIDSSFLRGNGEAALLPSSSQTSGTLGAFVDAYQQVSQLTKQDAGPHHFRERVKCWGPGPISAVDAIVNK